MKEANGDRSTRMALPSATSTWRSAAKHERAPVLIAPAHLEKEQRLENALDEYCQLREQDHSLTASRFCERYPSYRHSLRRLIDVHEALEGQPGLEEEQWPELFSEFLGYEILHELGVGAIARVYLATEAALGGRLVAIKVAQEGGDEAETLGKLTHPNIVPVFSVKHDEETDLTAVCMPYHGSATLADLLEVGFQDGGPPTSARVILDAAREREQIADFVNSSTASRGVDSGQLRGSYVDGVVRLGIQMAEALAYTHERGILHRDLKPSNVLLTPDGVPMLLDFNLASDIETGSRRLGGTLPYMPPEQIRDVHLRPFEADLSGDPRSDIFALGVILYELLTGKLPFGDPPACVAPRQAAEQFLAAQERAPRPVRERNPAVSPELARLLHDCLALEPSRRPSSAAKLVSELKKYFSPRRRVRRWAGRHRGLVATVVLMVTLAVSASVWHLATRPAYPIRQYYAAVADIEHERYRDAIEHLDRAILLDIDCGEFRFARGIAYQLRGEHELADIDLVAAAENTTHPLVLECCAYSKLRHGYAHEQRKAIAYYAQMSESMSPELELNAAYAYLAGQPVPVMVVFRATDAVKARPDWQQAYHVRALGHHRWAEQELKPEQPDYFSETHVAELNQSIQDFESALALGPPSRRLCLDAANAYALRDRDTPSERLMTLLKAAVSLGASKGSLNSIGARYSWRNASWFLELEARCDPNAAPPEIDEGHFVTPPDYKAVRQYLLETQPILSESVPSQLSKNSP